MSGERMTATRVLEDRRRFFDRERARAVRDALAPLHAAKARALELMMPTITIFHDGRIEVVYSDRDLAILAQYDKLIADMLEAYAHRFGRGLL